MQVLIIFGIFALILLRIYQTFEIEVHQKEMDAEYEEYVGEQEIISDYGEIIKTSAGFLAVLADGIGKEQRGKISSRIAVESAIGLFEDYQVMPNPLYFLKRSYHLANSEILKVLDGREGGASMACVLVDKDQLYYAVVGDVQIALFRTDSLIPLSEGHVLGKLAEKAYKTGKLSKQKALSALKVNRLYNYIGQDGFKDLDLFDRAVKLKKNDRVILMTKGIYEALPWQVLEDVFNTKQMSASRQCKEIIKRFKALKNVERDNGSVIVFSYDGGGVN